MVLLCAGTLGSSVRVCRHSVCLKSSCKMQGLQKLVLTSAFKGFSSWWVLVLYVLMSQECLAITLFFI